MNAHTPWDAAAAHQAAQLIWDHWLSGQVVAKLPAHCRPQTPAQGYATQAQLPVVSGRQVVGWKIAATSANGQAHINVSGPMAGRLLSGQVLESGATVPSAGNRMRVAEPEFAFAMAQDLPPQVAPYTRPWKCLTRGWNPLPPPVKHNCWLTTPVPATLSWARPRPMSGASWT
jgi:2-keto-4-pentenoate hydratase